MKKIIVAGGGHGGIAAAARLSEKGYDVTVYERNEKGKMGYDWTDIFNHNAIMTAGLEMPPKDKYTVKGDVAFLAPSENSKFIQRSPENQPEIKMERRDIYEMLISDAEKCGVKFEYNCNVVAPICENGRVVGIKTDKGDFFADLVIDACGCESPVRKGLPDSFGIQKNMKPFEKFYIYRAYFNNTNKQPIEDEFKLTLFPQGISGIGWVMSDEKHTDVLIGRFEPFSLEEAKKGIEYFRQKNINVGNELKRGGSFAAIPVRQPLAKMVADGYAAIGDSAFMAIPLIGSGIANALYASAMLVDAIVNDEEQSFSAKALWSYQLSYYKSIAVKCAPLACLKNILAKTRPEQLDNIFDNGLAEFKANISFKNEKTAGLVNDMADILIRVKNAVKDKEFSREIGKSLKSMAKLLRLMAEIPSEYSENEVLIWTQKYNRIFN